MTVTLTAHWSHSGGGDGSYHTPAGTGTIPPHTTVVFTAQNPSPGNNRWKPAGTPVTGVIKGAGFSIPITPNTPLVIPKQAQQVITNLVGIPWSTLTPAMQVPTMVQQHTPPEPAAPQAPQATPPATPQVQQQTPTVTPAQQAPQATPPATPQVQQQTPTVTPAPTTSTTTPDRTSNVPASHTRTVGTSTQDTGQKTDSHESGTKDTVASAETGKKTDSDESSGTQKGAEDTVAYTGAKEETEAVLAGGLIAAGAGLIGFSKRRRKEDDEEDPEEEPTTDKG